MAKETTTTPKTEQPKPDVSKKFGVEPTEQPDASVHQLDRGITPSADAPEPRAQL